MYKTRDVEVRIVAHPGACFTYTPKSRDEEMIEILVPTEHISGYANLGTWGSIMVKKEQVRTINDFANLVYVNDGAEIISSTKDANHVPVDSEMLLPEAILGRWLKWYRHYLFATTNLLSPAELDIPSERMYQDFKASRMDIMEYINRIPLHVPAN